MLDEYTFDIEQWFPRFPLRTVASEYIWTSSHGPGRICQREQLWRLAATRGDLGNTVPVDRFVLAYGEPGRPDVTKMGGTPYRPDGLEWPRSRETGHNYGFVAQFRIAESKGIVPRLPGDILLCFFERTPFSRYGEFGEPPVFEWYPLGLTDLVAPESVPEVNFELPPACYGLRYRTVNYVDPKAIEFMKEVIPDYLYDLLTCDETDRVLRQFATGGGLQIGGIPNWEWPEEVQELDVEPGPFVAAIPSLRGDCEGPYPWVNQQSEVWHGAFDLGFGGSVYLFLDADGNIQPRFN